MSGHYKVPIVSISVDSIDYSTHVSFWDKVSIIRLVIFQTGFVSCMTGLVLGLTFNSISRTTWLIGPRPN